MATILNTGRYTVPFDRSSISFDLPAGMTGSVVRSRPAVPLSDPPAAATTAVAEPLGSPPLGALAAAKTRVCIAVTDATRACPDHLLVPPLLAELAAAGVPDEVITVLVAVGTHRASTDA
ncbi:MAG: lactate racemase domain-containing protein, partial [Chloroflexota bacterium]|nr:lactate racemase domain-containing protein [Chloroflexota bacterium]